VAGVSRARMIVALDVGSAVDAYALVTRLGDACDFYKVGLQLFSAEGPAVVRALRERGKSVFVDLKAYDIPNTVRETARSVARTGASLLTVHASGGPAMVAAAVEGAGSQDGSGCGVLAVTVLTSFSAEAYADVSARGSVDLGEEVERLSSYAVSAGAHGVVCGGAETARIKARFGSALRVLVPGVRLTGDQRHDQARVVTPAAARRSGASYIVVGRAVTAAVDPAEALRSIIASMEGSDRAQSSPSK
jgi:orotidine-5'-phosphate decarboxylase